MTTPPRLRILAAAACALLLAACSSAERAEPEAAPEPTTSTAQAESRLAAVAAERAAIEARYADREAVCYEKFFVNRCLDQANEERRVALLAQRAIENEAQRYLRRAKVEERDRAMAEAEAAYQEEEARLADDPPAVKTPQDTALPPPRAKAGESRLARNRQQAQQKEQERAARADIDAAERAANVAAYEERRRKSEERQKEVARRVAEREAKAARQAEQAAAKANGTATAPAPAR